MFEIMHVDDTKNNHIVRIKTPEGNEWDILVPKESTNLANLSEAERPYGLNFVTGGHYE